MVNVTSKDAGANVTPMSKKEKRTTVKQVVALMAAIVVVIASLDQIVKQIMLSWLEPGVPVPIIGDWFRFYLLFNPGAAFSMGGENSTWIFTTIQLSFVIGIAIYAPRIKHKWIAAGLALVAGGALGNVLDRLFRYPSFFFGHVVDYISVGNFAVFNIADASISCGVVVFLIGMFLEDRENAQHAKATDEKDEA
ncbi:signal peptidase II [Corynebacterium glutamicum]|uniref:signal peptidase II n=1 Tax=Corynebacterium TaxID=1716 RepID=UPI00071FFAD4|nr:MULTISPECIES: signal peptidase II [Corynebacterium]ALP50580.1 peptidase A8 [Corynebacterium glutamicum]ANR62991.1 lipoprotein signal peptidase [[Brevibacterium] flavum ZL-1]ANR65996.1 lipoprotein signal peptidase [Corynebacterium glutamicum ZL-6]ANU34101.1 signal peptidase II [Corynebacterium glutamicum]APT07845.1 signal peptidase II [Corynebacterium glutamicum]